MSTTVIIECISRLINVTDNNDARWKPEVKNNGILLRYQFIFLILCRSLLLRIINVSDKSCRGNQNTRFMFSSFFPKIVPFMRSCGKIW